MPNQKTTLVNENQSLVIPLGSSLRERVNALTEIKSGMVDVLIQAHHSNDSFFYKKTLDVAITIYTAAELQLSQLLTNKFIN